MAITHASRLLEWYDRHRRTLPWRAPAGERTDPYRVWLSEIMLQQTTVATVGDYFRRFAERWPTLETLAAAPLDDVLSAWAGLGYYARARNLHACARTVVEQHGGRFPEDEAALLALPGIGRYTAAAIRAIAFDQPASAVDGNVERVIARLFAIETPLPEGKIEIAARAAALVPRRRAGDYAQAMMDLGATVCVPKAPRCVICPLVSACRGRALGIADDLPGRAPKREKPTRARTAPFCYASVRPKDCWAAWTRCRRAPGARARSAPRRPWPKHRFRRAGRSSTGGFATPSRIFISSSPWRAPRPRPRGSPCWRPAPAGARSTA
jgi:A/G-specific adenine glycosylase